MDLLFLRNCAIIYQQSQKGCVCALVAQLDRVLDYELDTLRLLHTKIEYLRR